jgi:glycosyltransferase involved in cell wall biosynthesis
MIPPNLVIANSHYTAKALSNLYPGIPTQVIYCPVRPVTLGNRESLRRDLRAGLETPEDAVVIIQASRLERWKGHDVLLRALGQLCDLTNWVCWLAGGPQRPQETKYLEELKERTKKLEVLSRVRFLGERDDIAELLGAADIYCQPNTSPEPFGIALIEALYAGLPVVTTALGGATEIVDESCGRIVASGDGLALAHVLRELIEHSNERISLSANGPSRGSALCDPVKQLTQLRYFLLQLMKEDTVA